MDIIDNASELEELHRTAALSRARLNVHAISATHCQTCGDELPEARRKAIPGCQLCASCKGAEELREKMRQ
ncbi:DnaK suppressor protein [Buttiauxella agrestis]|uniref:DnaK suppressor protein n=1 Tax=Buttiauxella agrestis TaxID=82977 RepID=A0A381C6A6_9ENTR|nr:TraR/DksA family transcriptional regulator [Buttiauxella agrestis]SUW63438.1 DnaK suppressor protein [Buttiauxella agrestis]